MPDPLDDYRRLRARTDSDSGALTDLHCTHLACKPGCHDCCQDLTVWPVEYHAILDEMRAAGLTDVTLDPDAACPFLAPGGLCGIYRFRPLICRTHGLPIAFTDPDTDRVSVSFCPKNFIDADPDDLDFGPENTLDLDALNQQLATLNDAFVHAHPQPHRRIPLRQLKPDLSRPAAR